jgi:hypothetical protein
MFQPIVRDSSVTPATGLPPHDRQLGFAVPPKNAYKRPTRPQLTFDLFYTFTTVATINDFLRRQLRTNSIQHTSIAHLQLDKNEVLHPRPCGCGQLVRSSEPERRASLRCASTSSTHNTIIK